jgi:hypothetical protein
MLQSFGSLSGTKQPTSTSRYGLSFHSLNMGLTNRAFLWQLDSTGSLRPSVHNYARDFRNYIPRPSNNYRIAYPHIFAVQFIDIVQRRITDGNSANEDRLQSRYRSNSACPSDLKLNIFNLG